MTILAHRGCWASENEKNSLSAIRRALEQGFGFESDIRDYRGKLVISHNIADESSPEAEAVFKYLKEFGDRYCFAVNVKADGLKELIGRALKKYGVENYFLFDMSVPQMMEFHGTGFIFFTRQSEAEREPVMYSEAAGVWLDGFWGVEWITERLLKAHLAAGKTVCLVSPELHGRKDYREFWEKLRGYSIDFGRVFLCTDYPEEAGRFFGKGMIQKGGVYEKNQSCPV